MLIEAAELLSLGPCGARGRCRISPPRFLAESRKGQLNQGSFVFAVCFVVYFLLFVLCLYVYFLCFILSIFLIVCLSVTVKWLAVKTAPEMTYTVSGAALNSTQSNPIQLLSLTSVASMSWCIIALAELWCAQVIARCPDILPDLQRCLTTNFLCPCATQVYQRILAIIW